MVRPHDILELKRPIPFPAPEWVKQQIAAMPFVLVRRAPVLLPAIPIGVRGRERNQRWAGVMPVAEIKRTIRPPELLEAQPRPSRQTSIAALEGLRVVKRLWKELRYPWGPSGSVAFELATGTDCARPGSDLDLVLYADHSMSREEAATLQSSLADVPVRVDVLVEMPSFAFVLAEYAGSDSRRILLRTPEGPRLVSRESLS